MRLTQIIESLLFASEAPLSAADLSRVDERLDEDTVEAVVEELRAEYELSERSFQIYEVAGGYQLLTRPEFVSVLERYDSVPQPSRLSAPALEVLAIIAYRQPLDRAEIEDIRGVGSSGVLRTLQERGLIESVARGEGLGRPLLYGTTKKFLEHCGFRSLEDLPRPDELPVVLRDRTAVDTLPPDTDASSESPDTPEAEANVADAPDTIVADAPDTIVADAPDTIVADAPDTIVADAPDTIVADAPDTIVADAPDTAVADTPEDEEAASAADRDSDEVDDVDAVIDDAELDEASPHR